MKITKKAFETSGAAEDSCSIMGAATGYRQAISSATSLTVLPSVLIFTVSS
jgi:hypothetical protein